jgi:NAD(P)-dependent dehydrogenase (short-subunit alcohol dehydrogenase family)
MRGLRGKVIVVAGGAGGIGTATCVRLAEEGAGIVVGDLNVDAAREVAARIEKDGGRAIACELDVSDDSSVAAGVRLAVDTFGGLDGLHANAADLSPATIGADTDVLHMSLDVFDRTLDVNLRGHVLCTRHALPFLLERGGGALVYTSSAAAFAGEPQRPAYAISKSGVNALVRHIASKWGKSGIRANGVAPGVVLSETVKTSMDDDFLAHVLGITRSARLGEPDDIAAMVAMLCSDDGAWINGQVISVDGGATLR